MSRHLRAPRITFDTGHVAPPIGLYRAPDIPRRPSRFAALWAADVRAPTERPANRDRLGVLVEVVQQRGRRPPSQGHGRWHAPWLRRRTGHGLVTEGRTAERRIDRAC